MTPIERATWEKIRELAARFQRADRIVLGRADVEFLSPLQTQAAD
jgi:hypothetical protein